MIALREGGDQAVVVSAGSGRGPQGYREQADGGIQGDNPLRRLFSHHLLPVRLSSGTKICPLSLIAQAQATESLRLFPGTDQPGLFSVNGERESGDDTPPEMSGEPVPTLIRGRSAGLFSAAEGFDAYA